MANSTHTARLSGLVLLLAWAPAACKRGPETTGGDYGRRWDELSVEERSTHMYKVVQPRMKRLFQEFDPERFAEFSCSTCHGQGAADGTYAMPSPDLPRVESRESVWRGRKQHPEMFNFMWKQVEGSMAELLGRSHGLKGETSCSTCPVLEEPG